MKMKTADAAIGKWRGILSALGIDASVLVNKHGPCPICAGNTRFRFDDKDGKGTWICNHCGAGDGMKLAIAITGLEFKDLARKIDEMVGNIEAQQNVDKPARDPREFLRKISGEIVRIGGNDPVMNYLSRRGVGISPALRLHPRMRYFEGGKVIGAFPAMVTPVVNPIGTAITFHVTYLTPEGEKASVDSVKKLMPAIERLPGSAIRLAQPEDGHIALAEGIETALAVTELFKVPCWSCINANMLEAFIPPNGITKVTIYADNDLSFTGQKSAYALAYRLHKIGISVSVVVHDVVGDFADGL